MGDGDAHDHGPSCRSSLARWLRAAWPAWPLRLPPPRRAGSASTSSAGLSSRNPLKAAWRTMPAPVHPANSISATSSGLTQCTAGFRAAAGAGGEGLSCLSTRRKPAGGCGLVPGRSPFPRAEMDEMLPAMDAHEQRAQRWPRRSSRRSPPHGRRGIWPWSSCRCGPTGRVRRAAWRRCLPGTCWQADSSTASPPVSKCST